MLLTELDICFRNECSKNEWGDSEGFLAGRIQIRTKHNIWCTVTKINQIVPIHLTLLYFTFPLYGRELS